MKKNGLKALRTRNGWTQEQAAEALGFKPGTYRHYEYASRKIPIEDLEHIATVYGVSVAEVLGSTDPAPPAAAKPSTVHQAVIRGNVAAGVWYDDGDWDGTDSTTVPSVNGAYGSLPQVAYRVNGDSMNLAGILDGGYVISVDYWAVRSAITSGDLVIVERRESSRVERTVKQVVAGEHEWRLEPRSSNPKHQPINIPKAADIGHGPTDREIEIVGYVIGYYRQLG